MEREPEKRRWKGRLVLLGNLIKCLRTGQHLNPTGDEFGLYGSVTTLQGFRAVCAKAVHKGTPLQSLDLTSAYINASWPKDMRPHFVRLTKEQWEVVPEGLRKQASELARTSGEEIYLKMGKCLYGHPLSGHVWIQNCLDALKKRGFVASAGDPALLEKGSVLVCVYVDDVAATGDPHELRELWEGLKLDFPDAVNLDEVEECSEFIGIKVKRTKGRDYEQIDLDMSDYAREITKEFKVHFPKKKQGFKTSSIPMADDLRSRDEEAEITVPEKRVQKLIGMLLWLSRCSRPDIGFATSRLGSRVSRWDDLCERELGRLVAYVGKTAHYTLRMVRSFLDKEEEITPIVHSDADLAEPRSQSGSVLFLSGPNGTYMPIAWQSKKQSLCADSVAISETIALHVAVREYLLLAEVLKTDRSKALQVFADNSSCLRLAARGTSRAASILQKAIRLRIGFLRDLREMGIVAFGHVRTKENRADALTKALSEAKLDEAVKMFGLSY